MALLTGVALVVMPSLARPFALPKAVIGETLGLLSVALLWPTLSNRVSWREVTLAPGVIRAVLPLALLATLSLAWSEHPEITRAAVSSFAIGVACLWAWCLGFSRRVLERFLLAVTILGWILALVVIAQYHDWLEPIPFQDGSDRTALSSLAGATGDAAAYFVLPILVAQGLARSAATRGRRILALGGLAVLVYGLLVTQTLTAIAAAGAASLILWWRRERSKRFLLVGGSVLLVGLAALFAIGPLRERVQGKVEDVTRGDLNQALTGRLDGWRVAVAIFEDRPVTGAGWGAYRAEFGPTKLELAERGVEFYPNHLYPTFQNAHNELLEVAAELGLLGLLALGWGLLETFRAAGRIADPERRAFALAGLVGLLLVSVAYFPFRIAVTAFPCVVFLAWLFRTGSGEEIAG